MLRQNEVRFSHRTLVVDWMHQVCHATSFLNQAVFQLAVSYLDRFLSKIQFKLRRLQLLAIACLYIAKKVESIGEADFDETTFPAELCSMTNDFFTKEEVRVCDVHIMSPTLSHSSSPIPVGSLLHSSSISP